MIFLSHSLQTTEKNIQLLCIHLTRHSMIKQEREHPIYCYEAYILYNNIFSKHMKRRKFETNKDSKIHD